MRTLVAMFSTVVLVGGLVSTASAATAWDESVDGDLSTDPSTPTPVSLGLGSNLISGSITGPDDIRDYLTFTIPAGLVLAELKQLEYVTLPGGEPGNRGFHAIIAGNTSFVPDATNIGNFLGGNHVDPLPVGTDMLPPPAAATLGGTGFTTPLGPGTYTYHIQQTTAVLTGYALDFELVPEPTTAAIMATKLMVLLVFTRHWRSLRRFRTTIVFPGRS
jgi:hypothetical protein